MIDAFFQTQNEKKKRVLLRGPVLTQSGYGVHARQVAKWLMSRPDLHVEIQALQWGDTPWLIDSGHDSGFVGQLMERTVDPGGNRYDVTVQLQLPNEWDPKLGTVNIGMTAGVETDRCNPGWIEACNSMSAIVVPSSHVENCLRTTGEVRVPLFVVPEAYSDAISLKEHSSIDDVDFSTPFNFLVFGQITGNNAENDRKNLFYTLKWLCEAFKTDESVGVIVKTNSGRNTCIDRHNVTHTLKGLLNEVRKGPFPKVHLLHGDMSDSEVASLYRHPKVKALVAATRGEGYGLPILEAAASGLPVIATRWSGHTDFLSHGRYIEIDYRLDAVHPTRIDGRIFVSGSKWAHPSEEDFKKRVTKFRFATDIPRQWAKDMAQVILPKYSLENVINTYNDTLKDFV